MKIVLYVHSLDQMGGAEIATLRLANCLSARGQEITILTTKPLRQISQYPFIDYTKEYRVIRLPVWQHSPATFRRMLAVHGQWIIPLLRPKAQILHLRGLLPETAVLARRARRIGIKTVCVPMASGTYGDAARFPGAVDAEAFDRVSALTEPLRQEIAALGYPPQRIRIIPNGVDTDHFQQSGQQVDAPSVIFVGQFRPEKRVDLLLNAWLHVQQVCPQSRLTLVGGGAELPAYQIRAAQLGLTPQFVPNTDDVLQHLRTNCIFVLPGISEGMSNALLEAMAVGLAPVVADTPANRAVITHNVNGLTYKADSPAALAGAILRISQDAALRRRIGSNARQTVIERFDLESVTDQYLALYAELLGETR